MKDNKREGPKDGIRDELDWVVPISKQKTSSTRNWKWCGIWGEYIQGWGGGIHKGKLGIGTFWSKNAIYMMLTHPPHTQPKTESIHI